MKGELEATIWCPRCRIEKFEVWRIPTENEQAFENVIRPNPVPKEARIRCECGTSLERKP